MLCRIICVGAAVMLATTAACKRSGGVATGRSAPSAASASADSSATPATPAVASTEEARAAEHQAYVMVSTSERPGEPKMTLRTYLLDRYVLSYTAENKLALVFDLEDESWVSSSGRQTTLAYAEGFVERLKKTAEKKWKERAAK